MGLRSCLFQKCSQNLSLSLTFRYLQAKAAESADSKNSVCLGLRRDLLSQYGSIGRNGFLEHWFQAANIGKKLDGQKLPARLGLGGYNRPAIQHRKPFAGGSRLQLSAPSEIRHLQAGIGAEYNFLKYGVVRAGYHFGDKDKGVGNYGTLGCGINFWPIRADFSYALADKDCFMRRTWQLGVGIVFLQAPLFEALLHFVHRHIVL